MEEEMAQTGHIPLGSLRVDADVTGILPDWFGVSIYHVLMVNRCCKGYATVSHCVIVYIYTHNIYIILN
jgi:hypothetical protein